MKNNLNKKSAFLDSFHLAGFTYYDGLKAFGKLKVGKKLKLKPEPNNPYDENAIEIYYKKIKLGYVPRNHNKTLSKFLNFGYKDIFEARIASINPSEHSEYQIRISLFIKK